MVSKGEQAKATHLITKLKELIEILEHHPEYLKGFRIMVDQGGEHDLYINYFDPELT